MQKIGRHLIWGLVFLFAISITSCGGKLQELKQNAQDSLRSLKYKHYETLDDGVNAITAYQKTGKIFTFTQGTLNKKIVEFTYSQGQVDTISVVEAGIGKEIFANNHGKISQRKSGRLQPTTNPNVLYLFELADEIQKFLVMKAKSQKSLKLASAKASDKKTSLAEMIITVMATKIFEYAK